MQSAVDEIEAAGAAVLAVSVDPPHTSAELAAELDLGFPLLCDPGLAAVDAYGLRHEGAGPEGRAVARPATFVLDRDGVVRWRDLTDNWRIRVRPDRILEQLAAIP